MGRYLIQRNRGLFFFENQDGETAIIRAELYRRFPSAARKGWFQQDGAAPHTSNLALDWLKTNFGSRIISLKTPFEWAPHSLDLSPPDIFLLGYLKARVYKDQPQTISKLKEKIRDEMAAISVETCKAVMKAFLRQMELCKARNGDHLEHLM